jgi:GMP synthase (glutamine-hydrolysing)
METERYAKIEELLREGIILSGSPYSVYAEDAPHADPALFDLGVILSYSID